MYVFYALQGLRFHCASLLTIRSLTRRDYINQLPTSGRSNQSRTDPRVTKQNQIRCLCMQYKHYSMYECTVDGPTRQTQEAFGKLDSHRHVKDPVWVGHEGAVSYRLLNQRKSMCRNQQRLLADLNKDSLAHTHTHTHTHNCGHGN
jgi:hypothetical protein